MATTKLWTVEELEREGAPEGRWELIDGELVEMSPSSRRSSRIGGLFVGHLFNHVEPRKLGEVHGAEGGWVIVPEAMTVRVPDAAFVRADRVASQDEAKFLRLAPDLVVEVISPSERRIEVLAKVQQWLDAGVRLLWLVDPDARTVAVYAPGREPRLLAEGDVLDGGDVLPEFRLPLANIFD